MRNSELKGIRAQPTDKILNTLFCIITITILFTKMGIPKWLKVYSAAVMTYGALRKIPILYKNPKVEEFDRKTGKHVKVPLLFCDKVEIVLSGALMSHVLWVSNLGKDLRYIEAKMRGYDVQLYGFKPLNTKLDILLE